MSNITIEVWDATGNKKQLVELPSDAMIDRVIAVYDWRRMANPPP